MEIRERYQKLVEEVEARKRECMEAEGKKSALEERLEEIKQEATGLGVNLDEVDAEIARFEAAIEDGLKQVENILANLDTPQEEYDLPGDELGDLTGKVRVVNDLDELLSSEITEG